jgi:hypothetical protein
MALVPWLVMLPLAAVLPAEDAEQVFFKAYYLEVEEFNFEGALRYYQEVAKSPGATPELVDRAAKRIKALREELKGRDLPRLLPSDALAYLEIRKLGAHLGEILQMLGFGGPGGTSKAERKEGPEAARGGALAISPRLIEGLKGLEGAALAVTNFDPRRGIPEGVAIVNLGRNPTVGGAVETALSAVAESGALVLAEPVSGHTTYSSPFGTVIVTERLVIAGSPHERAVEAVKRLESDESAGRGPSEAFGELKAEREDSLIFLQVDARKVLGLARNAMGRGGNPPEEYQIADAFLDLEKFRWAALRVGTEDRALRADVWLRLEEGNRCLAYNLLRTPALDREVLKTIPSGVAAVMAVALNEAAAQSEASPGARAEAARSITGLDLGREFFANVRTAVAFVSPAAAPDEAGDGPPFPQVGIEFQVRDPARSSALWSEILRVAAVVSRADPEPVRAEKVAGHDVSVYLLPGRFQMNLAALPDRVILTTGAPAMAQALRAAEGNGSLAQDADFSPLLAGLTGKESKALLVHGARVIEIARPLGAFPGQDGAQVASILEGSALTFTSTETPVSLQISLGVRVPELAPLIRQMIRDAQGHGHADRAPAPPRAPKAPKPPKPPKPGKAPKPAAPGQGPGPEPGFRLDEPAAAEPALPPGKPAPARAPKSSPGGKPGPAPAPAEENPLPPPAASPAAEAPAPAKR